MDNSRDSNRKQEISFDLMDLLGFIWQKKYRIILLAAVLSIAGAYYVLHLPKIYVSQSTLLLSGKDNGFSLPTSMSSFAGNDDSQLDTYIEFMRSRQFVRQVIDDLALEQLGEYQPQGPSSVLSTKNYAVDTLLKNLNVSKLSNTDMLKITVESRDPASAAEVANHIGPAFFAYYALINRQKADSKSLWLNNQLSELQASLEASEERLQQFLHDNELMYVVSQIELAKSEVSALVHQKMVLDKLVLESAATIRQLEQLPDDPQSYLQITAIQNNPLVRDLRVRRGQQLLVMNEVSKRYKFKHPRYIAAATGVDAINKEFDLLISQLVSGLRNTHQAIKSRQQQIIAQIRQAKAQHGGLGKHEMQLSRMRRQIESTQRLYEIFLTRLQETEILKDLDDNNDFAIVDYATEATVPAKPRVVMGMALSLIFSSVFSFGFWLLLHLVSDKYSRFKDILASLDVPLLTLVPKLKGQKKGQENVNDQIETSVQNERNYPYMESIRSLRTAVLVNRDSRENRLIAVTSIGSKDGKTHIATNLAESFSRMEKTLLLDADLRIPGVAKSFNLDPKHPGLTTFISRKKTFSQCIHQVHNSPLTVMPSGPIPVDPLVYISKPRFSGFLRKLATHYQRVVIDIPPINTVSDAMVLGKLVDGIIIVCDIEQNESADLLQALQRMQDAGSPVLGVVFNKVKNLRSTIAKRRSVMGGFKKVFGMER
jgi:succinoglycan biosynthesis transport protein ExoP